MEPEPTGPDISAYRGLGAWADIYDEEAFGDPTGAIEVMAAAGVRTLFLQSGNYRRGAMVRPLEVAEFIRAAHARGIAVVAWYLPLFRDVEHDLAEIMVSLTFRTDDGQAFDGFALDIEADTVPAERRIANLLELSRRLREVVGPDYPLGAIIPSPRGLIRVPEYWPGFPYRELPRYYDVILPMSYFTFHYEGAQIAHDYIRDNIQIVRAETGDPSIPIHIIGGLTEDMDAAETDAFVRAVEEQAIAGGSIYEYAHTTPEQWSILGRLNALS